MNQKIVLAYALFVVIAAMTGVLLNIADKDTSVPSLSPSEAPSPAPSLPPTEAPSEAPSAAPTISPAPSSAPSEAPSLAPSKVPSAAPSEVPSAAPSLPPSAAPSEAPSEPPSAAPSAAPSTSAPTASGPPPVPTENIDTGYTDTSAGGTMVVAPGTYTGEMTGTNFMGMTFQVGLLIEKAISIACTEARLCILDGENDHQVVYVDAGSGTAVSLTGLKITKGSAYSGSGAGVYIWTGSVTMTDCFISDNDATYTAGGVYVQHTNGIATLVHCVLEGNSGQNGGGLYVSGTATLYGCTFASNTASNLGADIRKSDAGTVTVNGDGEGYSGCTQGASLDTDGTISGTPNSFSGCTAD